jgi:hypothetical protein
MWVGMDMEMSNGVDNMGGRGELGEMEKTDEEMEMEEKEARRRDEESSLSDVSIPSFSYFLCLRVCLRLIRLLLLLSCTVYCLLALFVCGSLPHGIFLSI